MKIILLTESIKNPSELLTDTVVTWVVAAFGDVKPDIVTLKLPVVSNDVAAILITFPEISHIPPLIPVIAEHSKVDISKLLARVIIIDPIFCWLVGTKVKARLVAVPYFLGEKTGRMDEYVDAIVLVRIKLVVS